MRTAARPADRLLGRDIALQAVGLIDFLVQGQTGAPGLVEVQVDGSSRIEPAGTPGRRLVPLIIPAVTLVGACLLAVRVFRREAPRIAEDLWILAGPRRVTLCQ